MGTVVELDEGLYTPSRLAKILTVPVYRDTVVAWYVQSILSRPSRLLVY